MVELSDVIHRLSETQRSYTFRPRNEPPLGKYWRYFLVDGTNGSVGCTHCHKKVPNEQLTLVKVVDGEKSALALSRLRLHSLHNHPEQVTSVTLEQLAYATGAQIDYHDYYNQLRRFVQVLTWFGLSEKKPRAIKLPWEPEKIPTETIIAPNGEDGFAVQSLLPPHIAQLTYYPRDPQRGQYSHSRKREHVIGVTFSTPLLAYQDAVLPELSAFRRGVVRTDDTMTRVYPWKDRSQESGPPWVAVIAWEENAMYLYTTLRMTSHDTKSRMVHPYAFVALNRMYRALPRSVGTS